MHENEWAFINCKQHSKRYTHMNEIESWQEKIIKTQYLGHNVSFGVKYKRNHLHLAQFLTLKQTHLLSSIIKSQQMLFRSWNQFYE